MSKQHSSSKQGADAPAVEMTQLADTIDFVLDPDLYEVFVRMLDDPPAPGPSLPSLLRRVPVWRK
jgi:uncharacterized protein (DUF1778 family)